MLTQQSSPVTIEDDRTGYRYPAFVHTCGTNSGMYLVTHYAPRPGSAMHIHFTAPEAVGSARACEAVIRWRKRLPWSGSSWSYGLGIQCAR